MKKTLKLILSFWISFLPISTISCGTTNINPDFEKANNMVAFSNVFINNDKEYFSILPNLKENKKDNKDKEQYKLDKNRIVLDCDNFNCNNNDYKGTAISNEAYSSPKLSFKQDKIQEVQIGFDYIAYFFNINPLMNDDLFYDFENLDFKVDFFNTNLVYERNENIKKYIDLKITNYIKISDEVKVLEDKFVYSIKNNNLETKIIDKLLPKYYLTKNENINNKNDDEEEKELLKYKFEILKNEESGEEEKNDLKEIDELNYLNISIEYEDKILDQNKMITEISEKVGQFFNAIEILNFTNKKDELYIECSSENCKEQEQIKSSYIKENENPNSWNWTRKKIWSTKMFDPFYLDNKLINNIKINVLKNHHKEENEGENNL
ncbi:hypothetical protein SLITO_v1c05030 [Spiroplasma litorale]|uniref:Lipoprotein n=1 Tax=Spiroplasma litorale TaxID=216942 RepID=A0A0K1W1F3_9MOLU|nr:hypothetical protein [Spiroplasma litorale]AKX34154.1 hypothetical protein SLITO_v1c05030 [Spiroplasma litorale]